MTWITKRIGGDRTTLFCSWCGEAEKLRCLHAEDNNKLEVKWPLPTLTPSEIVPYTLLGTSVLEASLNIILAQHWKCVGVFSELLGSTPKSRRLEVMAELHALSVSFANLEQALLDCITHVEHARRPEVDSVPQSSKNTSTSGDKP